MITKLVDDKKSSTGKSIRYSMFGALDKNVPFAGAEEAILKYNNEVANGDKNAKDFLREQKNLDKSTRSYISSLRDAEGSMEGYNASLVSLTAAQKAAKLGQIALNAVLNAGIMLIVSSVISFAAKGIDDIIHRTDNLIEAGRDASKEISSISDTYKTNAESVNSVADSYARLAQGVDQASGKNKALSTDDYAEFLELSNQLADVFPQLVGGYDDSGNAMLRLGGNAENITETLQSLLRVERELANQEIAERLPAQFDGIVAEASKAQKEIDKFNITKSSGLELISSPNSPYGEVKGIADTYEAAHAQVEALYKHLYNAGADVGEYYVGEDHSYRIRLGGLENESMRDITNSAISTFNNEYTAALSSKELELEKTWSTLNNSMIAWLNTDGQFQGLSQAMQGSVQQVISNVDWNELDLSSFDEAKTFIKSEVLGLFEDEDIGVDLSKLINIDLSSVSDKELIIRWDDIIAKIKSKLGASDDSGEIKLLLGLTFDEREAFKRLDNVKTELLKNDIYKSAPGFNNFFKNLDNIGNTREIDILCGLYYDEKADYTNFDEFVNAYNKAVADAATIKVFDIAPYTTAIDAVQSKIGDLTTALDALSKGTFTAGDFLDLIQKFPELSKGVDATSDSFLGLEQNLKNAIRSAPKGLIEELKKFKETNVLTDEAAKSINGIISGLDKITAKPLETLSDHYGVLAKAITAATKAQSKFEQEMQKESSDDKYNTRIEALDILRKSLLSGEVGAGNRKYVEASKLLSGKIMSPEEAQKWIGSNAEYFQKGSAGLTAWLNKTMAMQETGILDGSGVNVTRNGANYDFEYNINQLQRLADAWEWPAEAIQDMIDKYRMYSQDYVNNTPDELIEELRNVGIVKDVDNVVGEGKPFEKTSTEAYATIDEIKNYAEGATDEELNRIYQSLKEKGVNILDDSGLVPFAQKIISTEAEARKLRDALELLSIPKGSFEEIKELQDGLKKYAAEYNALNKGKGNVDYTNRPTLTPQQMYDAGWNSPADINKLKGANAVTSYSKGFYGKDIEGVSKENENLYIEVTPILDNGKVLTPKELNDYVSGLFKSSGVLATDKKENRIVVSSWNKPKSADLDEYHNKLNAIEKTQTKIYSQLKSILNQDSVSSIIGGDGQSVEALKSLLKILGWAQEDIDTLISSIKEYKDLVSEGIDTPINQRLLNSEDKIERETGWGKGSSGETPPKASDAAAPVPLSADASDVYSTLEEITEKAAETKAEIPLTINTSQFDIGFGTSKTKLSNIESKTFTTTLKIKQELEEPTITQHATGTNSAKLGLSLLGDEKSVNGTPKPELIVSGDEAYVAGLKGPEVGLLNRGDRVFTYSETKKILGSSFKAKGSFPAFAKGSGGSAKLPVKSASLTGAGAPVGYDKELKELEHLLKMKQVTYSDYVSGLIRLEEKYRAVLKKDTDKWQGALEGIFDAEMQLFDVRDARMEHSLEILNEYYAQAEDNNNYQAMDDSLSMQADIYAERMLASSAEADRLRALGVKEDDEAIANQQSSWWDAYNARQDILEKQYQNGLELYDKYIGDCNDLANWGSDSEIAVLKRKEQYIKDSYANGLITKKKYCEDMVELTKNMYDAELDKNNAFADAAVKSFEKERDALEEERKNLEKKKSDMDTSVATVSSFVDEQIQKLQDENGELDKQLEVKKALEALDLAKTQRNKRVYKEGEGYVWVADSKAVAEAQESYDKLLKDDELEKKIKALEDYKKAWQDAVDGYQKGVDEQTTADTLGENWQKDVLGLKTDNIKDFQNKYNETNRQLDEDVDGSVANQIKDLDDLIDKWGSAVDDIELEANQYAGVLEFVKGFEGASYEERLAMLTTFTEAAKSKLKELKGMYEQYANMPENVSGDASLGYDKNKDYADAMSKATSKEELDRLAAERELKIKGEGISLSDKKWGTTDEVSEEWLKKHGYSNGGVVDYTGLAMLHGGSGYEEVVFNSGDAAKLFNYVQNTPDLVKDFIRRTFENKIASEGAEASERRSEQVSISIGDIYLSGVQDENSLSRAIVDKLPSKLLQELFRKV